jgi:phosphoribosylamine-glycine ligase
MKSQSFDEYLSLPSRVDVPFELALGAPGPVRQRLEDAGWATIDPRGVTRTRETYEAFIRDSMGEFGIAKHGYVVTNSGWFSERSLAYMANARPVVIQDTGFSRHVPVGKGVMSFTSPAEAVDALESIAGDERRHGLAAREIVVEHFEGRAVVTELLDNALPAPE